MYELNISLKLPSPERFRYVHPSIRHGASEENFRSWLTDAIRKKNNAGLNFMGCVLGEPGMGKSALILRIGELMNPETFNDRRMYFSIDEFLDDMENLEKGAVIGFDEAAVSHDAHFWHSMDAEDYKHITTMWRYKLWNCFYALPDFSFLLKSQRLLTHALIIIEKRQYAKVHGIVKDYLGGSRTRWSDSIGETRELKNWPMPSPHIWEPYMKRKDENFQRKTAEIEEKLKQRRMMQQLTKDLNNSGDMMVQ